NPLASSPASATGSSATSRRIILPSLRWLRDSRLQHRGLLESPATKLPRSRSPSATLPPPACDRNAVFPTSPPSLISTIGSVRFDKPPWQNCKPEIASACESEQY